MTPEEYCRNKAAPPGSNFYYSTLFHPPESKRKLNGIFAFYNELNEVVYHSSDIGAARLTLHWWAEEIERLFARRARHPVTQELAELKVQDFTTEGPLLNCISTVARTLEYSTCSDYRDWLNQHVGGGGYIWKLAGTACGGGDPKTLETLVRAGCCHSAFEQLHHIRRLGKLGFTVLPGELLNQHNISMDIILNQKKNHFTVQFFTGLFDELETDLDHCLAHLGTDESGKTLFSLTLLKIMRALCQEYRSIQCQIAHTHLSLTPLRKLWIAWRTSSGKPQPDP